MWAKVLSGLLNTGAEPQNSQDPQGAGRGSLGAKFPASRLSLGSHLSVDPSLCHWISWPAKENSSSERQGAWERESPVVPVACCIKGAEAQVCARPTAWTSILPLLRAGSSAWPPAALSLSPLILYTAPWPTRHSHRGACSSQPFQG